MKHRKFFAFIIFLFVFSMLCCFKHINDIKTELKKIDYETVFNVCSVYEKFGVGKINDEIHYEDDDSFIYRNGIIENIEITGYKHIHYLIKTDKGELFSAAVSENENKYLLKLDKKFNVISSLKVDTLPAKMFIYSGSLVVYYIDKYKACLYEVSFENNSLSLILDNIFIEGSRNKKLIDDYYKDLDEFFYFNEEDYNEFIKYDDLLFALFDKECFGDIHLYGDRIVYKSISSDITEWNIVHDEKTGKFENRDRCFGFLDSENLLFFKNCSLFFFDIDLFYKYNIINEKKYDYQMVFTQPMLYAEIGNDNKHFFFITGDKDYYAYYLLDLSSGIYERLNN